MHGGKTVKKSEYAQTDLEQQEDQINGQGDKPFQRQLLPGVLNVTESLSIMPNMSMECLSLCKQ